MRRRLSGARSVSAVLLALVLVGCGGATGGTAATGGVDESSVPESSGPSATPGDAPSASTAGLPKACDLLTADEVGAAIGKAVGEGEALGTFVCDWKVDPQSFGSDVSLLAQSMADEYCEPALTGEPVSGFGRAGTWDYSDSFDVPQGSLSACVKGGLVSVTLTGHVNDPSDEPGFRSRAESLLNLVLSRL